MTQNTHKKTPKRTKMSGFSYKIAKKTGNGNVCILYNWQKMARNGPKTAIVCPFRFNQILISKYLPKPWSSFQCEYQVVANAVMRSPLIPFHGLQKQRHHFFY